MSAQPVTWRQTSEIGSSQLPRERSLVNGTVHVFRAQSAASEAPSTSALLGPQRAAPTPQWMTD